MAGKAKSERTEPTRAFWLWVGIFLPPVVWAIQLQTIYLTSEFGCASSEFLWNHLVSLVSLILSLFGGYMAWVEWRAAGSSTEDEGGQPPSRRRFMAMIGILTGMLFSAIIFAQWLPTAL